MFYLVTSASRCSSSSQRSLKSLNKINKKPSLQCVYKLSLLFIKNIRIILPPLRENQVHQVKCLYQLHPVKQKNNFYRIIHNNFIKQPDKTSNRPTLLVSANIKLKLMLFRKTFGVLHI